MLKPKDFCSALSVKNTSMLLPTGAMARQLRVVQIVRYLVCIDGQYGLLSRPVSLSSLNGLTPLTVQYTLRLLCFDHDDRARGSP